jgi:hypothetical protein
MILSVSRRTDIPAFYAEWFVRRVRAGFVLVRNPMNRRQVSRISLDPAVVDWIVFWTKDPRPLMERLPQVQERYGDHFSFQYTLTPYDALIESSVPHLEQRIRAFQNLSEMLGPDRVVWRYDPIVFAPGMGLEFHQRRFEELANALAPYTHRCVVSLLDTYAKTERNMAGLSVQRPSESEAHALLSHMAHVTASRSMEIQTCAEATDFSALGVRPGKCIDDRVLSKLRGEPWSAPKDKGQRPACGCVASIDIGTYNTCLHGCRYCYATFDAESVRKAREVYDPDSPMLCDRLEAGDVVKERTVKSLFGAQKSLWEGSNLNP